jgi:hypothetical protein
VPGAPKKRPATQSQKDNPMIKIKKIVLKMGTTEPLEHGEFGNLRTEITVTPVINEPVDPEDFCHALFRHGTLLLRQATEQQRERRARALIAQSIKKSTLMREADDLYAAQEALDDARFWLKLYPDERLLGIVENERDLIRLMTTNGLDNDEG